MVGFLAGLSALPVPFFGPEEKHLYLTFTWFLLFFGGFILPQITGIMLNSVTEYQRTSANSVANLSYNLLGYGPAPLFYGFVSNLIVDEKSRMPMGCLVYFSVVSASLLILGVLDKISIANSDQDKIINNTSKNDEEDDLKNEN